MFGSFWKHQQKYILRKYEDFRQYFSARVITAIIEKQEHKEYRDIDTTNFKYEDYEDVIRFLAYSHYMDSHGFYDDDPKRYIMSLNNKVNDMKQLHIYGF